MTRKNDTWMLLLKAVVIITIFTALPHAFAKYHETSTAEEADYNLGQNSPTDADEAEEVESKSTNETERKVKPVHPLLGYWYTTYEDMEVGVTYEFRLEDGTIKAYSIEIYDKDENKVTDNTLAMTLVKFESLKGTAKYFMEYEGEKYEVDSQLKLSGEKLEISYSYYGYSGTEVWNKVK